MGNVVKAITQLESIHITKEALEVCCIVYSGLVRLFYVFATIRGTKLSDCFRGLSISDCFRGLSISLEGGVPNLQKVHINEIASPSILAKI